MNTRIYIIHTSSDTEWVKLLIEYLQASSSQPLIFESSLLSSNAASIQIENPKELKPALFKVDRVIAKVTTSALSDSGFNFQLGSAWALNTRVIALIDSQIFDRDFPAPLGRITSLKDIGPKSTIELAKRVLPGYIETATGKAVLRRLFGTDIETQDDSIVEANRSKYKTTDTLQGIPSVLPEATLSDADESKDFPFFLEAIDAGLAFSDCLFHRDGICDLCRELDQPFGAFFNSIGGNWAYLRGLNDIDLWSGAVDNLLESLPPERTNIKNWYAVGFHLSTLINLTDGEPFSDLGQRDKIQARWDNTLDAFRFAASAANIPEEDVDTIQSMLENLVGPSSDRDHTNMVKSRELVRKLAAAANYE